MRSDKNYILAGDIGGTKTRLGLFAPGRRRPILKEEQVFSSTDAPGLESILAEFIKRHHQPFTSACFGVAGQVRAGRAKLTNLPWDVSESRLRRWLGLDKIKLINDLTAIAHALSVLPDSDWISLNTGHRTERGPVGIIAPGTGLGMALIVEQRTQKVIVPSEGGHVDFAPTTMEQVALWQYLHKQCGHVSIERVLSGPGIFNIYKWLKDSGRADEPQWLKDELKDDDPAKTIFNNARSQERSETICTETLRVFISILGAVAGNLALTGLTTGGIYIAGGIAPRIVEELQGGGFLNSFTGKGRFQKRMEDTAVRIIINTKAPIYGAAACANQLYKHLP